MEPATAARRPGRPRTSSPAEAGRIAVGLFAERGCRNTTLEQVAAAAGTSRTTLFSHFPAERDLIWQELIERAAAPAATIGAPAPGSGSGSGSLVDVVLERIVDLVSHPAAQRADLALRWRIAQEDDELRACGTVQVGALARTVVTDAARGAPTGDARLIDHVVHASSGVATRCLEEWAHGAGRHRGPAGLLEGSAPTARRGAAPPPVVPALVRSARRW